MVSYLHKVAAEGKFVAVMSANVEGKEIPALEKDSKGCEEGCRRELEAALAVLKGVKVLQTFFWVSDAYAAANDSKKDGIFISSSYDATTHFESASREVLAMHEAITGKKLNLSAPPPEDKPEEGEGEAEGEAKEGKGEGGEAPAAARAEGDMSAAEAAAAIEAAAAAEEAAKPKDKAEG